ncbi:MAG: class I SAM-dependent methyltransferase [Thermomicrobiales bacterium]
MATQVAQEQELDLAKAQAFAFKVMGDTTSVLMGPLHLAGERLGLFNVLADGGPATSDVFALRAGIDARYAREWLAAMACFGYVRYDDLSKEFSLTPEQAFVLVNRDSPAYLGSMVHLLLDYWKNVDLLTDVIRSGGGVPQDHFGAEWSCGFERFSRTAFLNNLCQDWIPSMPEVDRRLRAGGTAADIGCGNGQALIELAKGYPEARLVGYDYHAPAIETARANAEAAGVADRVRFEVCDVVKGIPGSYDLITCFDVVHDMPRPVESMRAIRESLTPGGSFFVLEFNLSGDLQENIDHPFGMGAFGYAASVNYCLTTALAAGGVGTGTCMGERTFRRYAAEAGFGDVRRHDFAHNPLNLFYEVRA